MDTIYALASARGKAGVSIVRISGPHAFAAVRQLAGDVPAPRRASVRLLRFGGVDLDQALVLVFAAGASFTGEDVAELHLHGSVAVVASVLRALAGIDGLRLAEAGEFTRRALENGCLDLAQVEGLADLIEAETEAQRRQALRVLSGAIGARAEGWRSRLIRAAALLEASIDFADEEVPVDVTPEVLGLLDGLFAELSAEAAGALVAERIRDGFEVAIVGVPNAGKSTLLNALAGREAAIVSPVPGTTRDVIEVRMDLGGLAVTFLDTAGLRETSDDVERIGIARAMARAGTADLRVFLKYAGVLPAGVKVIPQDIVVDAKADTGGGVSGLTGAGIPDLLAGIEAVLQGRAASMGILTRERHRLAILSAVKSMESARDEVLAGGRLELAADFLRGAIRALDMLVGRVDVEQVLGEIFARFCIGK